MQELLQELRLCSGGLHSSYRVDWIYSTNPRVLSNTLSRILAAANGKSISSDSLETSTVFHEETDNLCFSYAGEEIVILSNCIYREAYNVKHVQQFLMEGPFEIPTLDEKVN